MIRQGLVTRVRDKSVGQGHMTRTVSTGQVLVGRMVGESMGQGHRVWLLKDRHIEAITLRDRSIVFIVTKLLISLSSRNSCHFQMTIFIGLLDDLAVGCDHPSSVLLCIKGSRLRNN